MLLSCYALCKLSYSLISAIKTSSYGLDDGRSISDTSRDFTLHRHVQIESRGSSVSIVSHYGLGDRGSIYGGGKEFFF
jgi:hypothetical protein